ncbi:ABC transporter permease [Hoylesella enoeca]|uniref:ABC transporter permease n=1 Tax=Hoylesella enoeca TaxID=76123 RepID=UPI00288A3095|nr:ABC transporter permease [Hoylesella enoeca]
MSLVWKLLRQHISVPQFAGFFFANLFGVLIVLSGFQFYRDVLPVFTAEDSFMKSDYIIVNKKIGTAGTLSGRDNTFNRAEIDELAARKFVNRVGQFTSTAYKVDASMGVSGTRVVNSELFFESIPDAFVDVPLKDWHYTPGEHVVPIILPRSYITMYNFGFAQSHALPKISDGLVGMIDLDIFISGNGHQDRFKGKVIGFSGRLNSILVPQSFMDWSNRRYAPDTEPAPHRLIIEVGNPADENIAKYMDSKGYDVEDGNLNAEKTTYFLRMMVSMVVIVGLIISALSFYILMLSIYLLVQKNASKLENLLLLGYSPGRVALPYQLLTVILNALVLVIVWIALYFIRSYYMSIIETLFPDIEDGSIVPAVGFGLLLFAGVSLLNLWVVRRKIMRIWHRKD